MSRPYLLALTAAAVLVLPAAAAQANDASVRAAIKSTSHEAKESPELKEALTNLKTDPKSLAKLSTASKAFVVALHRAIHTVEQTHASSSQGKQGEADWLAGVRKLAHGFEDFAVGIGEIKAGHKAAGKSELKDGIGDIKAGVATGKQGEKLLGIPSS